MARVVTRVALVAILIAVRVVLIVVSIHLLSTDGTSALRLHKDHRSLAAEKAPA